MKTLSFALLSILIALGAPALAQEAQNVVSPEPGAVMPAPNPAAEPSVSVSNDPAQPLSEEAQPADGLNGIAFNKEEYGSILFTHWEYVAIQDNINARGSVRPVTDAELRDAMNARMPEEERPKPPPEQRELRLAGIVYEGPGDWAFWLNEKRFTPDALPKEALDLKVYKNYIEMKWYDEWSNKIYPIRLRPHQRFNIDTRIFLPGS